MGIILTFASPAGCMLMWTEQLTAYRFLHDCPCRLSGYCKYAGIIVII